MATADNALAGIRQDTQPKAKPQEFSTESHRGLRLGNGIEIRVPTEKFDDGLTGKDYDAAIDYIQRMKKRAEETVAVYEPIECYPLEGAYALMKALQDIYGWANAIPGVGFFGQKVPPTMVGLEIGFNETTNVVWGRMEVPGVTGFLNSGIDEKDGRMIYVLSGEVKQKNMAAVKLIANKIREITSTTSIYRGKAIRVKFGSEDIWDDQPHFLDTSHAERDSLIFSKDLQKQINVNLWTCIEHTARCRQAGIPLKRGILLEGPYGTGKTLVAHVTAAICEANGWTFIYLNDVKQLAKAIQFANSYAPAVIFAEDVDKAVDGGSASVGRTDKVNAILNTIDGMDTKNHEIMVVLTTNHLGQINQAMLRPGRLDAVISVRPPDAEAVEKLIRLYGRGLIADDEDLGQVGQALAGEIPASIREVVERAKLSAISHVEPGQLLYVTGEDLYTAATLMKNHLELLRQQDPPDRTLETAVGILGRHLVPQMGAVAAKIEGAAVIKAGKAA